MYRLYSSTSALVLVMLLAGTASAQLSNQPFSFKNANGGLGMSVGGREAILNEKIQGIRPDNLVRAPNGELLEVQKGRDGSAFVSYPGTGQAIPQYRGTSYREFNPEIAAGVFNAYSLGGFTGYVGNASVSAPSGATVSTWTSRVTSGGMPISYTDGNVVDGWTGQVLVMGTAR